MSRQKQEHPEDFSQWQSYAKTIDPVHISWLKQAKTPGEYAGLDISTGISVSRNRFLVGVLLFSQVIQEQSPEKNIGLMVPSSMGGAITTMSILSLGKTVVNLNFTSGKKSLQDAAKMAKLKTIYTSKKFTEKMLEKGVDLVSFFPGINIIYLEDVKEGIGTGNKLKTLLLSKILSASAIEKRFFKKVNGNDTAAILFSSGSEGSPKGVELSHTNLAANTKQASIAMDIQKNDVMMSTLPTFHSFGFMATTLLPLSYGVPIVCHADPTDVETIANGVEKYNGTHLVGTPTFLRMYTVNRRVSPQSLKSIRMAVSGAEKLTIEVAESFQLKFNKIIYQGYGCTETSPGAGINVFDTKDDDGNTTTNYKPGTVGRALMGTQYRIVDPETMEQLKTGDDGLILIGGPQVMKGYLDMADKTADVIDIIDGVRWYHSGDKGHLDKDGFLTIVDRFSRFAKIGGEMVSLSAVEEQIQHSLKSPELELVAVAVSDDKKGEQIVLLVADRIELDEIKKAMIGDSVAPLMLPSKVINVEEIPKLGTGKTDFGAAKKVVEVHIS
jgi:acyl-[acyl-carrier-protein]-phospholipid O-acyltransferase/long-chain-fatty-acid--[acyl-carrier-protein] ligase